MTTRRERLEARLERRREWAASREAKARAGFDRAHGALDGIPPGQPILVGHHSERRHRAALERHDNAMRSAYESAEMAKHHASKAGGLEDQLERSIFSDDPDAVEALRAKVADLRAQRERMTLVNKLYRKGDAAGLAELGLDLDKLRAQVAHVGLSFVRAPYEGYQLSNLGANIRRLEQRIADVQRRQARTEAAEQAPGGVVVEGGDYVRVTFAEKPARSVLDALRAADFRWSGGSWVGQRAKLPAEVVAETQEAAPAA